MSTYKSLQIACHACGSQNIVPVISGLERREMRVLEMQGRILCGGCLYGALGHALWGCADCGEYVTDDRFRIEEFDTFPMREHRRQVERILSAYEPISEHEYDLLRGRGWLRTLIRSTTGATLGRILIWRHLDGFAVRRIEDDQGSTKYFDMRGLPTFDHMVKFVEDNGKCSDNGETIATLTVRVGREYRDFRIRIEVIADAEDSAIIAEPVQASAV